MNSDHKLLSFDMNETFSQRSRRPCLHTYTSVHKKRLLHWNQPVIATITSQFELLKIMNISTHHNDRMLTTVYNSKAPHINSASFSYRLSKMSLLHVKDKLAEGPKTTWFFIQVNVEMCQRFTSAVCVNNRTSELWRLRIWDVSRFDAGI